MYSCWLKHNWREWDGTGNGTGGKGSGREDSGVGQEWDHKSNPVQNSEGRYTLPVFTGRVGRKHCRAIKERTILVVVPGIGYRPIQNGMGDIGINRRDDTVNVLRGLAYVCKLPPCR